MLIRTATGYKEFDLARIEICQRQLAELTKLLVGLIIVAAKHYKLIILILNKIDLSKKT